MRISALAAAFSLALGFADAAPPVLASNAPASSAGAHLQTVAHTSAKRAHHPVLGRAAIIDRIEAQGYHRVRNVKHPSYAVYTATATTKRGRTVHVRASAYTGAVLSVRRA